MNWYSLLALANAMSCSSTCDRLTSSSARNGETFISHSERMKQARVRLRSPPEKFESGIESPTFCLCSSMCAISKESCSASWLKCSFPKRRYSAIRLLNWRLIVRACESLVQV